MVKSLTLIINMDFLFNSDIIAPLYLQFHL